MSRRRFLHGSGVVCWLKAVVRALRSPAPARDAGPTEVLDTQQLREAGLDVASHAQLRDLGIRRRPDRRGATAFSCRRSVL